MSVCHRPRNKKPVSAIGRLAVLPVFFDLKGKVVVVVGSDPGAFWKADLLEAAGASVTHLLESPITAEQNSQTITRIQMKWEGYDFSNAHLVIAAFDGDEEAQRFYAHVKRFGIPVNVIDRPRFCDFQFGSIVNRSPIVIGISTHGASPILGQTIRQKIETLLPPSLGAWGDLAKKLRHAIKAAQILPAKRKVIWQRLSQLAFQGPPPVDQESLQANLLSESIAPHQARLSIIPIPFNDPDCVTMGALRALQNANLILHGDDISPEILSLSRREAQKKAIHISGTLNDQSQALLEHHMGLKSEIVWLTTNSDALYASDNPLGHFIKTQPNPFKIFPHIQRHAHIPDTTGKNLLVEGHEFN